MMKKLSTFAFFLLAIATASAEERSQQQIEAIASSQFMQQAASRGSQGVTPAVTLQLQQSTDNYQLYTSRETDGFVVVSRDDSFAPVLGYSDSSFDLDDMPPALSWWLQEIDRSLAERKATGSYVLKAAYSPVSNFVTTTWGQGAPYNNLGPTHDGSPTYTGCVATAMAQTLNYYEYPTKSTGTSYYFVGDKSTPYGATLNSTFDWSNMADSYTRNRFGVISGTDAQKTAVATLMRECGYASHMTFSNVGSSSNYYYAAAGLTTNLGFDKRYLAIAERDFWGDEEWNSLIYGELQAGRPVLFSGVDPTSGGHAFLLSGIHEDGRVYVNWGWDGKADGFYDIADMAPRGIQGWGDDHVDHFNYGVSIIYNVHPTPESQGMSQKGQSLMVVNEGDISFTVPQANYIRVAQTSQALTSGLYNYHYTSFKGQIYLRFIDQITDAITDILFFNTKEFADDPQIETYGGLLLGRTISVSSLPNGTFTSYLVSKNTDGIAVPVRVAGGIRAYTVTKSGSTITIDGSELLTAIRDVKATRPASATSSKAIYGIDGRRLSGMGHGINIIREADGTVRKVMSR